MKARIHKIYPTVTTKGKQDPSKEYKTRIFVVDNGDQYNPHVAFELFGDKCSLVDTLNEGDNVEVSFNISSREWNGKWFTKLSAWKIDAITQEVGSNPSAGLNGDMAQEFNNSQSNDIDLPF